MFYLLKYFLKFPFSSIQYGDIHNRNSCKIKKYLEANQGSSWGWDPSFLVGVMQFTLEFSMVLKCFFNQHGYNFHKSMMIRFKTEENQKSPFPEAVQLWKEMGQSTETSKKMDIRKQG